MSLSLRGTAHKKLLRSCALEIGGVATILGLGIYMRCKNQGFDRFDAMDEQQVQAWEQVMKEWPLLLTADTLLSFQVLLRVLICASTLWRTDDSSKTKRLPLAGEPALFLFFAQAARVVILFRTSDYTLDGPLGGNIAKSGEVAALILSAALGLPALRKSLLSVSFTVFAAIWFAGRNHLSVAQDPVADSMFVAAHTLEIMCALTFFIRTLVILTDTYDQESNGIEVFLVYVMMMVQQAMPAYYFMEAFAYSADLVGAGFPFELLTYGNVVGFGALLASLAIYVGVHTDEGGAISM